MKSLQCIAFSTDTVNDVAGVAVGKTTLTVVAGDAVQFRFRFYARDVSLSDPNAPAIVDTARDLTGLSAFHVVVRASQSPDATLYAYQSGTDTGTDLAAGDVRSTVDFSGSGLITAIGTGASLPAVLEANAVIGGNAVTLGQCEFTILNQLENGIISPPEPTPVYYSAADIDMLCDLHFVSGAVDLTATGHSDLLTVSAGRLFVPLSLDRYVDSATAMSVAETVQVGTDGNATAILAATLLPDVGAGALSRVALPPVPVAAGAKLRVTISTGATATAASGRYIVTGYYLTA